MPQDILLFFYNPITLQGVLNNPKFYTVGLISARQSLKQTLTLSKDKTYY